MALSAKDMGDAIVRNMRAKTGKSVEEWIALLPDGIAGDRKRAVAWLKEEHGVGHYQAVTIFEVSQGSSEYDDRAGIEERLFGAPSAPLAQAYRALQGTIMALGDDVQSIACRTYIPFKRKRQFAVIAPSRHRLRLALALGSEAVAPPFREAKGIGGSARITHVVELDPAEAATLTSEVRDALQRAYGENG